MDEKNDDAKNNSSDNSFSNTRQWVSNKKANASASSPSDSDPSNTEDNRNDPPNPGSNKLVDVYMRNTICEFLSIDIDPTTAAISALGTLTDKTAQTQLKRLNHERELKIDEKRFIDKNAIDHVDRNYISRIMTYFGNLYAINSSFIEPNDKYFEINVDNNFYLDYNLLDNFFNFLGQYEVKYNDSLHEKVTPIIIELLSTIQDKIVFFQNAIQLRFIPILFELLYIINDDYRLVYHLINIVNSLHHDSKEVLKECYLKMPIDRMKHQVEIAQEILTVRISEVLSESGFQGVYDTIHSVIVNSLDFLRFLYDTNCTREAMCDECIDYREFHNDAINQTTQIIQHDFDQWLSNNSGKTKLQLLSHSFILDSANKANLLRQHAMGIQDDVARDLLFGSFFHSRSAVSLPFFILNVKRDHIVESTLEKISKFIDSPNVFRKGLKVMFEGEQGVDDGGVRKEFFQLLIQELFNPDYGMFIYLNQDRSCWFNMNSAGLKLEREFKMFGIILGLAIYNGVILDVHFPLTVYKKLLDLKCTLNDLREFQPEVAQSIDAISKMSKDELDASCLTFSVSYQYFDEIKEEPLGNHTIDDPITIENRDEFVKLFLNWHLHDSIKKQFKEFYDGFYLCCQNSLLSLFRGEDLHLVICGSTDLDFDALEKVTKYQYDYTAQSQTVKDFWKIVHGFNQEDKKKLLMFITGSDRAPINGLSSMQFIIGRNGPDSELIPTAHTCFNFFLLPDYQNEEKLRRLLRIALDNCQGFGLR